MKVFDAELQRSKRTRTDFALVMLDLDYFKTVNDEYGHLCGDALLTAVGRKMHELLRNSDVKVRYGGEEFLIMLPDTPLAVALHVARVLNWELGRLAVTWNGHAVSRTVSVADAKPGELDTTARSLAVSTPPCIGPSTPDAIVCVSMARCLKSHSRSRTRRAKPVARLFLRSRWVVDAHRTAPSRVVRMLLVFSGSEGERHRTLDDPCLTHAGESLELTHSAPKTLDRSLDHNDIPGMNRLEIAHLFDSEKVDQLFPVLGFGKNQNRANLGDSLGQDCRW